MDECLPVKTLEELLNWNTNECHVTAPLYKRKSNKNRPKLLVCHDMKGGYLEDRFVHGVPQCDCYTFIHWSYIDIFVYFSHNFITIPPCGWVTSAHRNGVPMLGTIITEWDEGKVICETLLQDEAMVSSVCNILVKIAVHYGFDGWLVNIENKIRPKQIKLLEEFVAALTNRMHIAKKDSLVIWYDSVISDGALKWQNCLNEKNRNFFHCCDGIFLNYNWMDDDLQKSVLEAEKRLRDVYVGMDIFGRDCLGGGGFNANVAMQVINKYNLSSAMFAPGWVYECLDHTKFLENSYKFWDLLTEFCSIHKFKQLPFSTSFCPGFGKQMFRFGSVISCRPWFNLNLQQPQASFHYAAKVPPGGTCMITIEDSYNGGGCLQLSAPQREDCKQNVFGILSTDFKMSDTCVVNYTYKFQFPKEFSVIMRLRISSFNKSYYVYMVENLEEMPETTLEDDSNVVLCPATKMKKDNDWVTRTHLLSSRDYKNHTITEIDILCNCVPCEDHESKYFSILLGSIEVIPKEYQTDFHYCDDNKIIENHELTLTGKLRWNSTPEIKFWDLFYKVNTAEVYLCTTSQNFYEINIQINLKEAYLNHIIFYLHPQSINDHHSKHTIFYKF